VSGLSWPIVGHLWPFVLDSTWTQSYVVTDRKTLRGSQIHCISGELLLTKHATIVVHRRHQLQQLLIHGAPIKAIIYAKFCISTIVAVFIN